MLADIFVSQGMANCNPNVDLLYRVCGEMVNYTNEDVYIRIDTPEDRVKCRQMRQAQIGVLLLLIWTFICRIMHIGLKKVW
jgi:hypothetical protein